MLAQTPVAVLIVAVAAVWRITHLLWAEDGPLDCFARLRRAAGSGFWGRLLDCFYCLSVWIAAPVALLAAEDWRDRTLLWFGLSGGAILLERVTAPPPPAAVWQERPAADSKERADGVLR